MTRTEIETSTKENETTGGRMTSTTQRITTRNPSFSSSVSAITLDNELLEDPEQSHNYTFPDPAKDFECANRRLSMERFLAEEIEHTKILPLRVPMRRFSMTLCQTLSTDIHDSNLKKHPEKRQQPPTKSQSAPKMPLRQESFQL